ncbi:class I SAM-dependent methyltransferase [Halobacteriovorax sp. XZX-3]|uniref:class I SAM-dependent rRNA methyltransferase n=1 Tax=unclassified Halobacteriovorax TaxID=2639665 RepID=UPI00371A1B86
MRQIEINKKVRLYFESKVIHLSEIDIEDSLRSFRPGEWCSFNHLKNKYIGFVNPNSTRKKNVVVLNSTLGPWDYISKTIEKAIRYRNEIGYGKNARLIYGDEDGLPGLILDGYQNCAILQINTAGMDGFRNEIKSHIQSLVDKEVILLDNKKYRDIEELPVFESDELPDVIKIEETEFQYQIKKDLMQKVGYYYDHRENRRKFEDLIKRTGQNYKTGLDLFTYVGSWGLHLLRAGVENVEFVDQANMSEVVHNHLEINNFSGRGNFTRNDVFKFLDEKVSEGKSYDVIVCDPPAFSKSYKDKKAAISGYEKLYTKIFKMINKGGILAAASCTQNISMNELDQCVARSAQKNNLSIRLIDTGIQGLDHPISKLESKSNYIKYLAYKVERND